MYGVDRDGPGIGSSANIPPLLSNGTQALTADWDAGSFEIRAQTFESDVATGTAPFVVASTTKVANLHADLLDGQEGSYYRTHANMTDLASGDGHTQYVLLAGRSGGQTIIGSTAASENLVLRSTSHATKGNILLGDAGGNVIIGGGTTASELRLLEPSGSGTHYTAFKVQAQAGNVTYTLPAADATVSGYALKSDAAGTLSWGPAGGTETKLAVTQASHGLSVGNLVYHNGSAYVVADKDSAATSAVVGIVEAVSASNLFTLLMGGYIGTLSGLTAGTVYFLGDNGALTATEPSTVGQISKPVLVAISTTEGIFINMRGSVVGTASSTLSVERFSGDGSDTTFTLGSSPLEENTFVMVAGVYQQKNTYSISGTTLTFSTAPPSGTDNIEVVTVGSVSIGTPSDNTVSTAKIVDNAVTVGKIADNAVTVGKIADNAVTVGKIADDAVTVGKIAPGATLEIQTAQATTSGSSKDWTIPAGTKQIVVVFRGVSTNGTTGIGVRLGTGSSPASSGYVAMASGITTGGAAFAAFHTDGFDTTGFTSAGATVYGQLTLTLMDASISVWACDGTLAVNDTTSYTQHLGGTVVLSGACDILRVYSADTFDTGDVNIAYK